MCLNGEGGGSNFIVGPRAQKMLGTRLDPSYQHVYFNEHHTFLIEYKVPVITHKESII